ncbi:helix-turn-helix domain-containing protein [Pedobacter sp. AW31-3R]|uniref:helix-turn-helix domain-containing protein n=1 Tax=Pedobacter sp. AW31-3R TaxID=3445781 RepID=UPI003F9F169E
MSQKEFADKVGLKEQQIQWHEANDFAGVSFDRILDFMEALNAKFFIKKTVIGVDSRNTSSLFSGRRRKETNNAVKLK